MERNATTETTVATPPPAPVEAPAASPAKTKAPVHFEDADGLFKTVCRAFMKKSCHKKDCRHVHDPTLCVYFWKSGECKFGDACKKNHFVTITKAAESEQKAGDKTEVEGEKQPAKKKKYKGDKKKEDMPAAAATDAPEGAKKNGKKDEKKDGKKEGKKDEKKDGKKDGKKESGLKRRSAKKNTECFEPMTKPVDLRVTYDLGGSKDKFTTSLTSRDVLLAPSIFNDFKKGELYDRLVKELEGCGIPEERLLKMWHGNDKIEGTHLIADDKTRWKNNCPTFQLVIDRIKSFFNLKVQATRFNWYRDTSQWKPFHFDAAAVKPEIAEKQNFTVAVSFGATRDAAFEHADTKTVVSVPQPDGCVYAFSRDTNIIWRHGILQDTPVRQEGRISVIAWGWIDGMEDPLDTVNPTVDA
ncbi:hypothetical protein Poli38472_003414 [Pythium oligandrum]|uniref:C3H1-type domain-containing protein n=1 Tax=Pythium oligandrum TaxID=41045 RepID=A0A8K1C6H1_PYTOL|nr:hypothetical protein Poli38472_003414 [Pythium oligandrum]|eukprot:TMW57489.1 hypothetical protein Poli38472_003414 [Pythium oligandrum]